MNICLRINPDIDAQTHHYISTGQFDDKFGISFKNVINFISNGLSKLRNIQLIGLHYHVGSQILNLEVYRKLIKTASLHIHELKEIGINIKHLNLGGGLGVDYENPKINPIVDFESFFSVISEEISFSSDIVLHFELGRSLVAQSGVLLSKVLFTKTTHKTNFAIVDAGMTELIRPALYQASHKIEVLNTQSDLCEQYHIVGPICESSDFFAKNIVLPKLKRNDLIAIYSAGAYAKVLASEYNLRPAVQEYFI